MLAKYWRFSPSSIRGVPGEVLQQIFAFVVFNEDGGASNINSCMRLRCLCSVSHQWRQAAIGHCILWTRLHPITVGHTDETRIRKSIRCLHLHLERSGVLPISFSLTIYPFAWPQKGITDPAIFDMLRVLLNQCHRWGKVQFDVPLICFAEQFTQIRGEIPLLSELAIDSSYWVATGPEADDSQPQLNCFAHAPSLRKVVYASSNQRNNLSLFTRFELPWSQVEELKVDGGVTGTVMAELGTLTLPSLKHLEVRGHTSPGQTFDSILGLIKRSGCSLEHLCVLTLEHGPQVSFPKILALSPQITELYIASPGDDMLEALVLDPTSPDPVLPKMKTLLIFDRYLGGARSINIAALSAVIKSRTGRLGKDEDTPGMAQALEEVILYSLWWDNGDWRGNGNWWDSGDWWDNGETLQKQISLLEMAHADGGVDMARIPNPLEELASEARTTLFLDFAPQVVTRGHVYNLSRHFKMHQLMSKLERVDLEKDNSRIFVYKGIAYLLALVNSRERGQVPGDPLFQFRSRAGKLLKKWKPFLIRDVNSYTWGHVGKDITCMKWIPGSIVEGTYWKDEDIWNVITGKELAPRTISRF